jgi:hypothetical protein
VAAAVDGEVAEEDTAVVVVVVVVAAAAAAAVTDTHLVEATVVVGTVADGADPGGTSLIEGHL